MRYTKISELILVSHINTGANIWPEMAYVYTAAFDMHPYATQVQTQHNNAVCTAVLAYTTKIHIRSF